MMQETSNLILIVNDNPDQLEVLGTLLRMAGYKVQAARNGREGLELARKLRPRLVLSDVNMPQMDGMELCRRLRADPVLRSTAIMLVTAERVDSEHAIEGLRAGADDYLEAPYDPMRMVAKVTRLMERKQSEESLRESEEKYRQIVETANEGIWMIDLEGQTVFANSRLAEMLGTTIEEVVGRSAFDFVHQEDLAEANKRLSERRKGLLKEQTEFRVRRRDGRPIYMLSNTSPLKNQAGEVTGLLAMISDITERKRAEEALRESEEGFRSVFEGGPVGMAIVGLDSKIMKANRAACELLGYTEQELSSLAFPDITYPEDMTVELSLAESLFKGEISKYQMEKRFVRKDREILWVNLTATLIRDIKGNPLYGLGIVEDVTERKHAEESLRRSEHQLTEAQRLAHIGSWDWDIQSNSLTWSEEMYRIYGLDAREFTPTYDAFMSRVYPEDVAFVAREVGRSLKNLQPLDYHLRIARPDGEVRILHSQAKVVADERGLPLRLYGAAQDVTERVLAEEQLKSSNEKLRALAARLQSVREEESLRIAREIHDELGGAMTGLKIDLAWLHKRMDEATDHCVRQKIASMNEMIDDTIGNIRHISSELRPPVLDDLGLSAAIEWQAREFETRTEITCRITSLAEDVSLDQARAIAIFRIFQEILTNVIRHARATLVEVSLREQNDALTLRVKDNGVGISETDVTDTGSLGLLGMRERALVFGGIISVEGSQGSGTTVTVRIPLK